MIDGWNEPVDTLLRLRTAVRIVARAKGNPRARNKFADLLCRATFALTGLLPEHFPERIRGRATKVLSVRARVRQDYGNNADSVLFHFEWLSPKERDALISDILGLYEACLLDLGRMADYRDIVYPQDR
jgi:hypothetical protein